MAADILLYRAEEVPVGDDQRQHLELACVIAQRFNTSYGETFVVPRAATPVRRKIARAVTDPDAVVRHDPEDKPGVSNLLEILGACTGSPPDALAGQFTSYRRLKDAASTLAAPTLARAKEAIGLLPAA